MSDSVIDLPSAEDAPALNDVHSDTTPSVARSPRRWMMWGAVLSVTLIRYVFGLERRVYSVYADEPATLGMARYLSGGTRWNLFNYGTWKPGLATLLAPVYALTDDATVVYRVGLALNSLIAGLSVIAFAVVIRKLTPLGDGATVLLASGIAVAPISLFASAAVWAEPLVTVTFLLVFLALMRLYETGELRCAFGATALAVFGYFCHNRLLMMVAVVTPLAVAAVIRNRRRAAAAMLLAWTACLLIAAELASRSIVSAVWEAPTAGNTANEVLRQFRSPTAVFDAALGQAWYLMTATFGLAAVGLGVAARHALRTREQRGTRMRLLLALTIPQFALSALFMADRHRGDHLIYGRYNDAIVWPLVAVGVAWWVGQARRDHGLTRRMLVVGATMMSVIAAAGAGLHALHHSDFEQRVTAMQMVPGIVWLTPTRGTIDVVATTALAIAVITLALVITKVRTSARWFAPVLTVALLALAGVRTHSDLGHGANTLTVARSVKAVEQLVPAGETVGFAFNVESDEVDIDAQRAWAQAFQFYLPHTELATDGGPSDDVGPYIFAPMDDQVMFASRAEVLWLDARIGIALWREPDTVSSAG